MKVELSQTVEAQALSITQLNREVRRLLELNLGFVWVHGELSNLARPRSGHWYFSLKDDAAQVSCAMFKGRNRLLDFQPEEGQEVLARASVTLYEPRGNYQLIIDKLMPTGAGRLQQAFERLKAKLTQEGLFDTARKRALPKTVNTLGVITSPSGAALQDILKVLRRRAPQLRVIVYPSPVQGHTAAAELAAQVRAAAERRECELLIIARGGGSAEDLASFNDEALARELSRCPIPLISGVGHEVDVTICDFIADLRAPTPSAAAELASEASLQQQALIQQQTRRLRERLLQQLQHHRVRQQHLQQRLNLRRPERVLQAKTLRLEELDQQLEKVLQRRLERYRQRLQLQAQTLSSPPLQQHLNRYQHRLMQLESAMRRALQHQLQQAQQSLGHKLQRLEGHNPAHLLARGFAIARRAQDQQLLTRAESLEVGDKVLLRLSQGSVSCVVEEIES